MTIRFIGDVHGKYTQYKKILKDSPYRTIQVGDMGVGFLKFVAGEERSYANPPYDNMKSGGHRFIRGNHDNPRVCKKHTQYIPDGTVEGNVMFIGGALSIDRNLRLEHFDWWADEELSVEELDILREKYLEVKPKIMVTHECPEEIAKIIVGNTTGAWPEKLDFPSRTRDAFQHMFSGHSPDIWVFGHWHVDLDIIVNDTRFICLNELKYIDLEVDDQTPSP